MFIDRLFLLSRDLCLSFSSLLDDAANSFALGSNEGCVGGRS